ncbi:MAG TPA: radical SAM protein [Gemmatimonadaceae bacterium]|nr:radical SAM protein [Gemmatimonadaceae bacterium]
MLSERFKPWHVPLFAAKYAWLHVKKFPILVHFEVTMRCNAGCGFCDYWKTPKEARDFEVKSFADAARFFNPLMIIFVGGEPTLRRDLEDIVAGVAHAVRLKYISVVTHGGMLTPERAKSLWEAGLNQFSISLDYLDERHDRERRIPGLTAKIFRTVPRMQEMGIDNIRFNTVIKNTNLDQILPIARRAKEMGVGVAFSAYTDLKNGNRDYVPDLEQARQVEEVVRELLAYKRRHRGVVVSSDYYLEQVPRYFRGELTDICLSGQRTIHVNPTGHVRRCPDFPVDFHWTEFRKYEPIDCNACYYACRGESQAPLTLSRIRDVSA